MPVSLPVPPQDSISKLASKFLVAGFRSFRGFRDLSGIRCVSALHKRRHYAFAHLRRGFPGKRNRDDLFRLIGTCKQCEVTLNQKPGLTRPGGRLNNKGIFGVEHTTALGKIRYIGRS